MRWLRRFLAWLLRRRQPSPAPQPAGFKVYDPAFVRQSFRPGDTWDPLSPQKE